MAEKMPRKEPTCSSPGHHKRHVRLPKVTVDSLSKAELKELIPRLMKLVTGREDIWHSRRSGKPKWWPAGVTWPSSAADWASQKYRLDKLRAVVWNCYRSMRQTDLLCDTDVEDHPNTEETKLYTLMVAGNMSPVKSVPYPSRRVRESLSGIYLPFSTEIYICYFCEREFINKAEMRSHQHQCDHRPPQLQQCLSSPPSPSANIPPTPPMLSPRPRRNPIAYACVSRQKFAGYLDLLPEQKAAKLVHERCSLEVNCDVLDDVFEPHSPTTPITPRTPKSLISQMSREDPVQMSKRRLSYSLSMDKGKIDSSDDSDSDSDMDRKSSGAVKEKLNFLNIDISSPLGQRIQKHVHVETPVKVGDFRTFCKTPVKNNFLEKLRKKPLSYPVVYRQRRVANLHRQRHLYKFTKRQTREFMAHINTGLTERSRTLVKQMRRLRVDVVRLTRSALLKYVPACILDCQLQGRPVEKRRVVPQLPKCDFPPGPTLLVRNIDKLLGLKKRSAKDHVQTPLSLANLVSEDMEADVSRQKLTLYRSLLHEVSLIASPKVLIRDLGLGKRTTSESETRTSSNDASTSAIGEAVHTNSPSSTDRPVRKPVDTEVSVSAESSGAVQTEYQTLRSMLTGRTVVMHSPASSREQSAGTLDGPVESASKEISDTEMTSAFSPPDNASVCIGLCSHKSPNTLFSPTSPTDDDISIISAVSSDNESFKSNCCHGCTVNNQKQPVMTTSLTNRNNDTVPLVKLHSDVAYTPPLSVNVDNERNVKFSSSRTEMKYGVPSPVSVDGESPTPTISDKMQMCLSAENGPFDDEKTYNSVFATSVASDQTAHPRNLIRGDTDHHTTDYGGDKSTNVCEQSKRIHDRPTRSSSSGLPDVFTQAEINESIHRKPYTRGLSSNLNTGLLVTISQPGSPPDARYTRSQSSTPASSPWMLRTRSLPSTPQSSSSSSVKRHIFNDVKLQNTPSSLSKSSANFNKSWSCVSQPTSTPGLSKGMTNSGLKLKLISSTTSKTRLPSPHCDKDTSSRVNKSLSVLSVNKDLGKKRETRSLSCSISQGRNLSQDSRRKKRLSSVLQGIKPTKLRKVYSDMALSSR